MIDFIQWLFIITLIVLHIVHFSHERKIWEHIKDLWRKRG